LRISAFNRLVACTGGTLNTTVAAGLRIAAKPVPLADVERAWAEDDSARRPVFKLD